jgi:hypothetical protein
MEHDLLGREPVRWDFVLGGGLHHHQERTHQIEHSAWHRGKKGEAGEWVDMRDGEANFLLF